jgi:hypothetical protein
MDVEAYCMKCKATRKMNDAQEVTMENGRRAAKGICPVCGTKMTKFLPSDKSKATSEPTTAAASAPSKAAGTARKAAGGAKSKAASK